MSSVQADSTLSAYLYFVFLYNPNPGHLDKPVNNDRRTRNVCMRERPTDQDNKLCVEVNKDSNDPKDFVGSQNVDKRWKSKWKTY